MFQQTIIIGRLVKDPEVKALQDGESKVAKFTVVTTRRYFDSQTQEWKEQPDFHVCSAWNKIAGTVERNLKKGNMVHIVGRNQTRKFEKNGQTHWSTEVVVSELHLFPKGMNTKSQNNESSSPDEESPEKPKKNNKPPVKSKQRSEEPSGPPDDFGPQDYPEEPTGSDDIPF